jgi:hypothetical protein
MIESGWCGGGDDGGYEEGGRRRRRWWLVVAMRMRFHGRVRRGRGSVEAFLFVSRYFFFYLVNIIYNFLLYKKKLKILCGQGHMLPQRASVPVHNILVEYFK